LDIVVSEKTIRKDLCCFTGDLHPILQYIILVLTLTYLTDARDGVVLEALEPRKEDIWNLCQDPLTHLSNQFVSSHVTCIYIEAERLSIVLRWPLLISI